MSDTEKSVASIRISVSDEISRTVHGYNLENKLITSGNFLRRKDIQLRAHLPQFLREKVRNKKEEIFQAATVSRKSQNYPTSFFSWEHTLRA